MCHYPFPAPWKTREKEKTPNQLWFVLMWHLIWPLKGTAGCPPTSTPPSPVSTCSPQAKPRWVHVKDHMTIEIPDPAGDWDWICPNSSMSQAARATALKSERPAFFKKPDTCRWSTIHGKRSYPLSGTSKASKWMQCSASGDKNQSNVNRWPSQFPLTPTWQAHSPLRRCLLNAKDWVSELNYSAAGESFPFSGSYSSLNTTVCRFFVQMCWQKNSWKLENPALCGHDSTNSSYDWEQKSILQRLQMQPLQATAWDQAESETQDAQMREVALWLLHTLESYSLRAALTSS